MYVIRIESIFFTADCRKQGPFGSTSVEVENMKSYLGSLPKVLFSESGKLERVLTDSVSTLFPGNSSSLK